MTDLEWMVQDIKDELDEMENEPPSSSGEIEDWDKGYCAGLRFALWVLSGSSHGN